MKLYYDETDKEQFKFIRDAIAFKHLVKVVKSDFKTYLKKNLPEEEQHKNYEIIKSVINENDLKFLIDFNRKLIINWFKNSYLTIL